jgi:hypothetical protein
MPGPRLLPALILVIACKGDPARAPSVAGSASTGSGSASPASRLAGITLPPSTGTPPKRTTAPLAADAFERLAKLTVPGFTARVRSTDHQLDVVHTTGGWSVGVMIAPCFDCLPMELAAWRTKEAGLRLLLPADLRDRPDTVWELGYAELHGAPMIFTYQLAHGMTTDAAGTAEGTTRHAYALYYNDGANQIRVVAEDRAEHATRGELEAVPRGDLATLAAAVLDLYTHAW